MFLSTCMTIESDDIDALSAFYVQMLGFAECFRRGDWVELELNGAKLALRRRKKSDLESHGRSKIKWPPATLIGIQTDQDLNRLSTEMKSRGLKIEGTPECDHDAGVSLLFFRDPQDNRGYFWHLTQDQSEIEPDAS